MKRNCTRLTRSRLLLLCVVAFALALGPTAAAQATSSTARNDSKAEAGKSGQSSAHALEHNFFAILREGNATQFLSYVPEGGVSVGPKTQRLSRTEVEDQVAHHTGLYCKLFDSACIPSEIKLDNSGVRACSYRELLTKSGKVRTAATETTRNGVRQAILVAEVKNDTCAGVGLIDFIFNLQADGWKLFSIP